MARQLKTVFTMIMLLTEIALAQTIAPVKVVSVRLDKISEVIEAHGIIQPYPKDDVKISAVLPMRIEAILVKPGDPIENNQLVIKLQRDRSIDVAVEKARVAKEQVKLNFERAGKLFKAGVIAKVKLEQAQTAYNLAKADYEIQQRSLEYAIKNSEIRSPINGVVSSVNGVANVVVLGGRSKEYEVLVNPERLRSFKLSLTDLVHAIQNTNVIESVGKIEQDYKLFLTLLDGQYISKQQIG